MRRPVRAGVPAVGLGVVDPDHHAMGLLARSRRQALAPYVRDDHRSLPERHLGTVVFADLHPLHEAEDGPRATRRLRARPGRPESESRRPRALNDFESWRPDYGRCAKSEVEIGRVTRKASSQWTQCDALNAARPGGRCSGSRSRTCFTSRARCAAARPWLSGGGPGPGCEAVRGAPRPRGARHPLTVLRPWAASLDW